METLKLGHMTGALLCMAMLAVVFSYLYRVPPGLVDCMLGYAIGWIARSLNK